MHTSLVAHNEEANEMYDNDNCNDYKAQLEEEMSSGPRQCRQCGERHDRWMQCWPVSYWKYMGCGE